MEIIAESTSGTTAKDVMSTELLTVEEGTSVEDALKILINHRITGLPVLDKKGKLIGVLSEYDILLQISKHRRLQPEIFREACQFSPNAECVDESTSLEEVVRLFINSKFRRLPVKNNKDKLVGIITRRDLMRLYYYRAQLS